MRSVTLPSRRSFLAAGASCYAAAAQSRDFGVQPLTDPLTKRRIRHYRSPHHEVHHYYFVSPWSPSGRTLLFFQFHRDVAQLTARGRYPGRLCLMDLDGGSRRVLAEGLMGHYHVGVNQFWGDSDESVYFIDTAQPPARLARIHVPTGEISHPRSPVPCSRLSPSGNVLSCGRAGEWGVYTPAEDRYERLVTLERVLALSPNRTQGLGVASQLQNTRFSPTGDRVMIVHRTVDDPPRLIEIYVYDFRSGQLTYLAQNLHHPGWRPDGKAILFVRWDPRRMMQNLWKVDVETLEERCVFDRHLSAVHCSYHPGRPNLVLGDCYGGEFGNGLVLVDLESRTARHLVSIPQGAGADPVADERFPFRNFGLWMPPRKYLNEPRPVWNADGTRVLYTSEESGRINLYIADTSDL
ncbi:MAG: PD40 domain-containing protein [Bryobacterales bacterium]|nr:PD40 domain-containing protein [Bryobacterales bacterium]